MTKHELLEENRRLRAYIDQLESWIEFLTLDDEEFDAQYNYTAIKDNI